MLTTNIVSVTIEKTLHRTSKGVVHELGERKDNVGGRHFIYLMGVYLTDVTGVCLTRVYCTSQTCTRPHRTGMYLTVG